MTPSPVTLLDRNHLSVRRTDTPDGAPATLPSRPPTHAGLLRIGVLTYICALLLIAAFSIAFHFITDNIVNRQNDTARIVNISGRQRMLSQRIARLTLERAAHTTFRPDADTQADLLAAIDLMQSSHQKLLYGSPADRIDPPASPSIAAVYTSPPYLLNTRLNDFLAHARAFAIRPASALTVQDPDLTAIEAAAQEPLLTALDAAVAANQATSEAAISHLRRVLRNLTILMLLILLAEALFLYRPLFRRLRHAHAELVTLGRTDPLTGCLNRRAFTQEAAAILSEAQAEGQSIAILMIDIDHFKSINDRFGHPAGDKAIHEVVLTILRNTRAGNLLCRMGGEEFAILLRGTTLLGARTAADNLRVAVAAKPIHLEGHNLSTDVSITVSIGITLLDRADHSIFTLLARADKALYAAKQNGRNRIEADVYAPPAPVRQFPTRA